MKKLFIILLALLLLVGCTNKGENDISTTNVDNQTSQEAGATFLVDGKEIFLTWEELQKPENGELYDYETSEITDTQISDEAFFNCHNLTSITIPDSVTEIFDDAFCYCLNLSSISVNTNNPKYTSIDGILFEKNNNIPTKIIRYPAKKSGTSYTIPNSVTSIGINAFYNCSNLISITISNSVTSINDWAFSDCSNLTSITIPNSVTSIESGAFYNCSSLASLTIGNSVTSIGDGAFCGCFNLTSITIPDLITEIGYGAFRDCPNLTSISVDSNNPNYVSIDGVLFQKTNGLPMKLIRYPEGKEDTTYTIPYSVINIDESAFEDCEDLISITISNSVTSIGGYAFSGCSSLISLTIPNSVTKINNWAFSDIPHIYYNGPAIYEEYDPYWGALAMN